MTDIPQLTHEQVTQIAQEHEDFLNQLESLAISAIAKRCCEAQIASDDWWPVHDLISDFRGGILRSKAEQCLS